MIIPHDDKVHRGGEDAAFANDTILVVADGVGGWALKGINPGLFSETLVQTVVEFHERDGHKKTVDLLSESCRHAGAQFQGTATVAAVRLIEDLKIEASNLGDSGYALFHVNPDDTLEMYFRSLSQQKTHNFPY